MNESQLNYENVACFLIHELECQNNLIELNILCFHLTKEITFAFVNIEIDLF